MSRPLRGESCTPECHSRRGVPGRTGPPALPSGLEERVHPAQTRGGDVNMGQRRASGNWSSVPERVGHYQIGPAGTGITAPRPGSGSAPIWPVQARSAWIWSAWIWSVWFWAACGGIAGSGAAGQRLSMVGDPVVGPCGHPRDSGRQQQVADRSPPQRAVRGRTGDGAMPRPDRAVGRDELCGPVAVLRCQTEASQGGSAQTLPGPHLVPVTPVDPPLGESRAPGTEGTVPVIDERRPREGGITSHPGIIPLIRRSG